MKVVIGELRCDPSRYAGSLLGVLEWKRLLIPAPAVPAVQLDAPSPAPPFIVAPGEPVLPAPPLLMVPDPPRPLVESTAPHPLLTESPPTLEFAVHASLPESPGLPACAPFA